MKTDLLRIRRIVFSAVESQKPAKMFRQYRDEMGDEDVFVGLDAYLGDLPDAAKIMRVRTALSLSDSDLHSFSVAEHPSIRRVARLLLLHNTAGVEEDFRLQKGLNDAVAQIRADAARFCGTGEDRTRLYNQLVRLVREDPDTRVRRSAGLRLSESFVDLYAVDFQGLPELSRMFILDALEGKSRSDEKRAESLLNSSRSEAAFRAARQLYKWGTLRRFFDNNNSEASKVLEQTSHLGVVDYLDERLVPPERQELALRLAGQAGRKDIVKKMTLVTPQSAVFDGDALVDVLRIETVLNSVEGLRDEELLPALEALPLGKPWFKRSVNAGFPPPERDGWSAILFQMARVGRWSDWSSRATTALESSDPDIRKSAALCLADIAPEAALAALPSLLLDPVKRVRRAAATGLAALPSGEGGPPLADYLTGVQVEDPESVIIGVRDAGSMALARCVVENAEQLGQKAIGRLLEDGIGEAGVEMLVEDLKEIPALKSVMKEAGPRAGESLLAAWPSVKESAKKRLSSWIAASGWVQELPKKLEQDGKRNIRAAEGLLGPLSREERRALLEPMLESTSGWAHRRIKKLMRI